MSLFPTGIGHEISKDEERAWEYYIKHISSHCSRCDKLIEKEYHYCPYCGHQLKNF